MISCIKCFHINQENWLVLFFFFFFLVLVLFFCTGYITLMMKRISDYGIGQRRMRIGMVVVTIRHSNIVIHRVCLYASKIWVRPAL